MWTPGGEIGILLKSNAPLKCTSAERRVLRWGGRIRFRVVVAWVRRLHQSTIRKLGSRLKILAMKLFLNIFIACSSALRWWT